MCNICTICEVDNGRQSGEVLLNRPSLGLDIPPKVWAVQYKYTPDAVLTVLASSPYDAADYIRDYDEFLDYVRQDGAGQV